MATKTNQTSDLSEHKRKIFFEHLSPKTTKDSLREYLSGFEIEKCAVPYKEGKNKNLFCFNKKKYIQFTVFEELFPTLFIYFQVKIKVMDLLYLSKNRVLII
jgi:hypothetical protein